MNVLASKSEDYTFGVNLNFGAFRVVKARPKMLVDERGGIRFGKDVGTVHSARLCRSNRA